MTADVPDSLTETKDAFLLQCALGCHIGERTEVVNVEYRYY